MTAEKNRASVFCEVCQKRVRQGSAMPLKLVHGPVAQLIRKKRADLPAEGFICFTDLNHFRSEYIEDVLEQEKGELSVSTYPVQAPIDD